MSLASPVVRGIHKSATEARADIVAALNAAGLNAANVAPDSATPGAAWPQWTQTDFQGHLSDPSRFSFSVYVVLNAADPATTVEAGDTVVFAASAELVHVVNIIAAEPVLITFGDKTTMPGIRFRVITRM